MVTFPRIETDRDDHERIRSRFFGDDFAVLPNVDGRAVHARGLAGDLGGAAQRTADGGGEFFTALRSCFLFHGDLSNSFAVLPELSYTLQTSAKRR
jgi:hypothetical protein